MSEFDNLLERLIDQRRDLSISDVRKMIEEKKKKIGSGYLTDQGALFLIASDLGVSLNTPLPTKKETYLPEKEKEKETQSDKQSSQSVTDTDLDNKYKTLSSDKMKYDLTHNSVQYLLILAVYAILGIILYVDKPYSILFLLSLIGLVIIVILLTYIIKKPARRLEKKEIIFLKFCKTYQTVKKYQYRDNDRDTKKYNGSIVGLAYFVGSWARRDTPSEISSLPESISKNLRDKPIRLFKENSKDGISMFTKYLGEMVFFTYKNEPTLDILKEFNKKLLSLPEPKQPLMVQKKVKISSKYSFLKFIWISPLAGVIIYIVFVEIWPTKQFESAQAALAGALAIMLAIVQLARKK